MNYSLYFTKSDAIGNEERKKIFGGKCYAGNWNSFTLISFYLPI